MKHVDLFRLHTFNTKISRFSLLDLKQWNKKKKVRSFVIVLKREKINRLCNWMVEVYDIYSPLIDSWLDGKSTDFRVDDDFVVDERSDVDG